MEYAQKILDMFFVRNLSGSQEYSSNFIKPGFFEGDVGVRPHGSRFVFIFLRVGGCVLGLTVCTVD